MYRLIGFALFLLFVASVSDADAQELNPPINMQSAVCHEQARVYAAQFVVMTPRIKVPIFGAVGLLIGQPYAAAIIGANAESPIERRIYREYVDWCMGWRAEPPRLPFWRR